MRKEVPHSMILSTGLWLKGHHSEGEEGKGTPQLMEIGEGVSEDFMSR